MRGEPFLRDREVGSVVSLLRRTTGLWDLRLGLGERRRLGDS
jgi:hypothetical protein